MMAEPGDRADDPASRVLIVDDSAAVRDGLRTLLETDPSLRSVGEAATATEGLARARELRPDLILLDNEMPGGRGIELLPVLRMELPKTLVVVFSMSPAIADEAYELGANAVVSKDGSHAKLLDTLRELRRGEDSTTVRLARFARLGGVHPSVAGRDVGILLAAMVAYAIAFLAAEPGLGAGAAALGLASVTIAGLLLGPALGAVGGLLVIGLTWALWTITGHPADSTVLRLAGNIGGAVLLIAIGAVAGAIPVRAIGERRADALLRDAISGSARGSETFTERTRAALRADAVMLFGLSGTGRLRIAGTAGIVRIGDERTFVGVPTLAKAVRDGRIITTASSDDLVAGARSAAFAPVLSAGGTPVGVLAVFYRRAAAITPADRRRLAVAAAAAEAVLG